MLQESMRIDGEEEKRRGGEKEGMWRQAKARSTKAVFLVANSTVSQGQGRDA